MGRQGAPKGVARAVAQAWRQPRGWLARRVSRRRVHWQARSLRPGPPRGVRAASCARRGCTGCCFCVGVALPIYLEIHSGEQAPSPIKGSRAEGSIHEPYRSVWVTVEQVQQMVTPQIDGAQTPSLKATQAVPAYLLHSQPGLGMLDVPALESTFGRVICLPGAVRSHIAAD